MMDQLYAKHNMKVIDLQRAVTAFDLDKEPDVIKQQKENQQAKQQMVQQREKMQKEMGSEMDSILTTEFKLRFEAGAKAMPPPEVSPNNFMSFESFVAIQQYVMKNVHELIEARASETKQIRRSYLKNNQE